MHVDHLLLKIIEFLNEFKIKREIEKSAKQSKNSTFCQFMRMHFCVIFRSRFALGKSRDKEKVKRPHRIDHWVASTLETVACTYLNFCLFIFETVFVSARSGCYDNK